jgi:hypothetical protein
MALNEELSLRQQVLKWYRDHPLEASKRDNTTLYEAFGAETKKAKMLLRACKSEYLDEIRGWVKGKGPVKKAKVKPERVKELFTHYSDMVACPHCPGAYANELYKFIGFRGRVEKRRHSKGGYVEVAVPDIKGEEVRGEARPEPIIPVTKRNRENLMRLTGKSAVELGRKFYLGALKYEIEIMTLLFLLRNMGYEDVSVQKPRGHGKTYINTWGAQIDLKWFDQNLIILSETSARLKIGNWIYLWALQNNYIAPTVKFSRKSTYHHFTLLNGTSAAIYKFTEEKIVGEHDAKLKLDDTIKKKWRHRPTENAKQIEHWQSNINFILRTGLEDYGTRKYEGDPMQHRMETIEDIIVIKLSPFIRCKHNLLNPNGTFDPCAECRDLALLAPEINSYDYLMNKMEEDYESWYAEMMQDPHPKKGGMVEEEDILYVPTPFHTDVKMGGIGVDVAEEWEDSLLSDMSAIVPCVMCEEKEEKRVKRKFVFYGEDVRRMPFRNTKDKKGRVHRGIIETIDHYYKEFRERYFDKPFIIAIERNGSGIVLINQILREKWEWMKLILADKGQAVKWSKEGRANVPLGIKHQSEKIARINSELRHSIKEHQTCFTENLEDTTFMTQLLAFPKGKHDDGPDAAGMIKDELNRRWSESSEPKPHESFRERLEREQVKSKFNKMAHPWEADRERAMRRQERQNRSWL